MTSLYQGYPSTSGVVGNSNSDGWILYYSPEGFPYYYNEITGESQWAENEQEISEVEDNNDVKYDTQNEEFAIRKSTSNSRSDDNDDSSSDNSSVTETSTSATEESDGFNQEFQAYLDTPEGQHEMEVKSINLPAIIYCVNEFKCGHVSLHLIYPSSYSGGAPNDRKIFGVS